MALALSALQQQNIKLASTRLQLSLMTEAHWPVFYQVQSNPKVMRFIAPDLSHEQIYEKFQARIATFTGAENHWFTFIIKDKTSGEYIGSAGFKLISINHQQFELGYAIKPEYAGKGLTTETAQLLINFLFHTVNAKKVLAQSIKENIASWKVMEKLGMTKEAEYRHQYQVAGKWHDAVVYSLLNKHHQNGKKKGLFNEGAFSR